MMYQRRSYWNKSLKHRKLWRFRYVKGNHRYRQLIKANIGPWRLLCLIEDLTEEETGYYQAMSKEEAKKYSAILNELGTPTGRNFFDDYETEVDQ